MNGMDKIKLWIFRKIIRDYVSKRGYIMGISILYYVMDTVLRKDFPNNDDVTVEHLVAKFDSVSEALRRM